MSTSSGMEGAGEIVQILDWTLNKNGNEMFHVSDGKFSTWKCETDMNYDKISVLKELSKQKGVIEVTQKKRVLKGLTLVINDFSIIKNDVNEHLSTGGENEIILLNLHIIKKLSRSMVSWILRTDL